MDPSNEAEKLIATEIAALTGKPPEHEPAAAQLPSGSIADFRFPVDSLGYPGRFLLVEVKSLHDLVAGTGHWLIDFAINHPDAPKTWSARTEWTSAGKQRLRELGVAPTELTSMHALRNLTSNERLRALAGRGGKLYQLAIDANQIACMILFGSTALTKADLRWPATAVGGSFAGVVPEPLDPTAVAFWSGEDGRPSVARDVRASLQKKFAGYDGPDACLAVVVSDADRYDSWSALLEGNLRYPVDGSEAFFQIGQDLVVPGLLVAVYASERPDQPRWSYRTAGSIETAESFKDICLAAPRGSPRHPKETPV